MADLTAYLRDIVEPTFEDFKRNPHSMRHAYLACVATYHAIDRAALPRRPGNLRKMWRAESVHFAIVDMVAHKLKHVISDDEKQAGHVKGRIPLSSLVFGSGTIGRHTLNTQPLGSGGVELHNLLGVVRDAIEFVRSKSD